MGYTHGADSHGTNSTMDTNPMALAVDLAKAIDRGLAWLAKAQGNDGAFSLPFEAGAAPTMVMPLTYLWGGDPRRARETMAALASRFVRDDGSIHRPAHEKVLSERYQHPYGLGWITRSALACDQFDVVQRCAGMAATYQHPSSGGFFGLPEEAAAGAGVIDMPSTGMGGLAMVAAGRLDAARAAGDYVLAWLDLQEPGVPRFWTQWHTAHGFVRSAEDSDRPPNGNAPLVISHDTGESDYWLCGILVAFLAELHMATGNEAYLDAANRIFSFAATSPVLGEVCRSHKFAWGAARLHAVTGESTHLEAGQKVARRLMHAQQPDGHFVYIDFFRPEDARPHGTNVVVTSQFVAWLAALAREMG